MTTLLRTGDDHDVDACVRVWLESLEARDGSVPASGIEQRARAKLAAPRVSFVVAEGEGSVDGFVLVSVPGSGFADDPPHAAYLSLLAVRPSAQGRGLARRLLAAAERDAAEVADEAVLHVLLDNTGARALYASAGWSEAGEPFPHPLSGAPVVSLRRLLDR
ncbi:GNAT family N-acetyltransferase [Rathayibacter sp. VKM Ac-2803]|uniref:GNAT family N-acetyltransferase n=1 Tax=unclassified Rathayibacter TaxID=2609250 RepID=UPI001356F43D|nr:MULTISPECIES: GNAT family N-acetyltransferase [unclassified Rathayibacter]MWV49507.1 GNAT family N-acetyltransferase [Rathayibacter sp. VKM Ac-2803]MWV60248.1 GNAT family N-acetyltransferase [Rathayibacter sp. VKM Ac-2754]